MDNERDCYEDERDDWSSYTYNAWKGGRIPYAEACDWEDEDDDDDYDDDWEEYWEDEDRDEDDYDDFDEDESEDEE